MFSYTIVASVTVHPRDIRVVTFAELADVLVSPIKMSVPVDIFAATILASVVSSSAEEQFIFAMFI